MYNLNYLVHKDDYLILQTFSCFCELFYPTDRKYKLYLFTILVKINAWISLYQIASYYTGT